MPRSDTLPDLQTVPSRRIVYLSHPEVLIDPAVPVADWLLSNEGLSRLNAALRRGWPLARRPDRVPAKDTRPDHAIGLAQESRREGAGGWRVISSPETKAVQAAQLVANALATAQALVCPLQIHRQMAEVDRSATGYLPAARHAALADALFARPRTGPEGWEAALDAQTRIIGAFQSVLAESPDDILLVGHGAIGTFLWCHLAGLPIARLHDQPRQGCVWRVDLGPGGPTPRHPWLPLEAAPPA